MADKRYDVSPARKGMFYAGMALSVIGLLTFLSVFVSGALNFGNFDHFEERGQSMATRAVAGMFMMIVGGVLMTVGRAGAAGAGLLLDPKKSREDLEPWNRAAGGMVSDTLDEVGVVQKLVNRDASGQTQVKVRCPQCKTLNDEDAKFCDNCGHALQ